MDVCEFDKVLYGDAIAPSPSALRRQLLQRWRYANDKEVQISFANIAGHEKGEKSYRLIGRISGWELLKQDFLLSHHSIQLVSGQ